MSQRLNESISMPSDLRFHLERKFFHNSPIWRGRLFERFQIEHDRFANICASFVQCIPFRNTAWKAGDIRSESTFVRRFKNDFQSQGKPRGFLVPRFVNRGKDFFFATSVRQRKASMVPRLRDRGKSNSDLKHSLTASRFAATSSKFYSAVRKSSRETSACLRIRLSVDLFTGLCAGTVSWIVRSSSAFTIRT